MLCIGKIDVTAVSSKSSVVKVNYSSIYELLYVFEKLSIYLISYLNKTKHFGTKSPFLYFPVIVSRYMNIRIKTKIKTTHFYLNAVGISCLMFGGIQIHFHCSKYFKENLDFVFIEDSSLNPFFEAHFLFGTKARNFQSMSLFKEGRSN